MDSRSGDGPEIIRPIPRRPFNLNFTSPTPPDDDESSSPAQHISANDLRFLDPRHNGESADTLSRAASLMNLTSSTLFGIYSPTATDRGDRFYDDRDESSTPWSAGAETPAKRPGLDDETYKLMRERSSKVQRAPSYFDSAVPQTTGPALSGAAAVSSLVFRAALLFALGMGYGVLVTRLPSRQQNLAAFGVEDMMQTGYDWRYLAFWGVAGVALGSLLPWFDRFWEETFGRNDRCSKANSSSSRPEADWALVVRGIGAFVGIVFAIRRLPWTSTMQVSLTLALANPFLWYLIDRSKPGFLLSAAVGLTGSAILMGLNPDMMPAPTAGLSSASLQHSSGNGTGGGSQPHAALSEGFISHETLETGIWMLSVLFCSCVCFGNIGRRLALNRSAADRGRWGGVR
ncbi:insulin-induced protein-domain-containing protein [Lasiosphaeria miniovina]|uniref:Insulin-induced protein-domain-containing protein n=1 Tax=Lasiosphaeria miniovina TaxID=1954250 RepID=A0AA40AW29_9PEZI|nr:insulin-induced protein-domain-containing protein [Lasiosphaeria miniovina]KAK0723041.1 insulin-induced protein-domain-containing protein [Lasiosphaeria miniovina]